MATQTAIDQSVAQTAPETAPDAEDISAQGATMNPSQLKQETGVADLFATGEAKAARLAHSAAIVLLSTAVFVSSVTLATTAFFTFSLVSFRMMPTFRRLVANAEVIRVPVLRPVTLAEIARELFLVRKPSSDGRAVSSVARRAPTWWQI